MGGPYKTGDVEDIIGVGEHVLRYWEKSLPILSPVRSPFGRREWTATDIALLLRVKHFVKNLGYDLSQTMEALIKERSGDTAGTASVLYELRASLVSTYFESKHFSSMLRKCLSDNQNKTYIQTGINNSCKKEIV